ncbi:MAG: hypothetical protein K0R90_1056 [Oscillospiraceae bacterium]|jgi:NADH:ubiquinone oxidoreductase subunit E|nr:hypothetical protein [Oscillospiraceae bacterium]
MKKLKIEVCSGSECTMMGAMDIIESIEGLKSLKQQLRLKSQIEVIPCKCFGDCKNGQFSPIVKINDEVITNATSDIVMSRIIALSKMD